ncbi:MAG: hypothetical protein IT319_08675 [Anaerolineae bacterium]|nr:hypothetical protein [Anaerolineae bacterium]
MPETTPDTTAYLVLALVVFFGLLALYIGTLVIRANNLRKDEVTIEQLTSEG